LVSGIIMNEEFPSEEQTIEEQAELTKEDRMRIWYEKRRLADPPRFLDPDNFEVPSMDLKFLNGVRVDPETNEPIVEQTKPQQES
jgi:hypothetical protein